MAGTAVFRMVVSRDSMKKATATNQGRRRLLVSDECGESSMAMAELDRFMRKGSVLKLYRCY
jgi:hypothetical protein